MAANSGNQIWLLSGGQSQQAWFTDSRLNTQSIPAPTPTPFPQAGQSWSIATGYADFHLKQGAAGAVFNNRLWVLGGEDENYNLMNDVWSSGDGINWTQTNAQSQPIFTPRANASCVVFNPDTGSGEDGKLWMIGGFDANGDEGDVWSSPDGTNWTEVASSAGFGPRDSQASVVFNDRIWVIGGHNNSGLLSDVWSSSDGANWYLMSNAPFSPREGLSALVFNNQLWVIGGDDGSDVWSSPDGVNWNEVSTSAAFSGRSYACAVTAENRMWLIGGLGSQGQGLLNDVWSSTDGATWTEATSQAPFKPRDEGLGFDWNGDIWIATGEGDNIMGDV